MTENEVLDGEPKQDSKLSPEQEEEYRQSFSRVLEDQAQLLDESMSIPPLDQGTLEMLDLVPDDYLSVSAHMDAVERQRKIEIEGARRFEAGKRDDESRQCARRVATEALASSHGNCAFAKRMQRNAIKTKGMGSETVTYCRGEVAKAEAQRLEAAYALLYALLG